jgi:hypothetical protein
VPPNVQPARGASKRPRVDLPQRPSTALTHGVWDEPEAAQADTTLAEPVCWYRRQRIWRCQACGSHGFNGLAARLASPLNAPRRELGPMTRTAHYRGTMQPVD